MLVFWADVSLIRFWPCCCFPLLLAQSPPSTVSASHKWSCPRLGDGCECKRQNEAVEFRKWMRLLIFTNGVTDQGWRSSPAVGLKDRNQESEVYFQVLTRVSGWTWNNLSVAHIFCFFNRGDHQGFQNLWVSHRGEISTSPPFHHLLITSPLPAQQRSLERHQEVVSTPASPSVAVVPRPAPHPRQRGRGSSTPAEVPNCP